MTRCPNCMANVTPPSRCVSCGGWVEDGGKMVESQSLCHDFGYDPETRTTLKIKTRTPRDDYASVYILQYKHNNGKNWHNTGEKWYSGPQDAIVVARQMEAEHKGNKMFRVAKFTFAFACNGSGEKI